MKRNNKKGFTIVELVIVIAVIAILSAVLIPTFGTIITDANTTAAQQEASNAYKEYFITVMKDGKVDDTEKTETIGDFTLELATDGTLVSVTSNDYTFTVVDGAITKVEPKN